MSAESVLFDAPGPKARRRHAILTVVGIAIVIALLGVVIWRMNSANQLEGYMWQPFVSDPAVWTSYLLGGLWGTIKAALLAVVLAGIFGIVFGMGRLSENKLVRLVSGTVVEVFRAIPVLLMMIFFFIGWFSRSSLVDSAQAPLAAVVLALTLYNGAVIAELVRSGVHSLPKGQREAGLSIGLTSDQTLRSIQLPQALTAMLPALISQFVVILKDTALGYLVLYGELLNAAKTLGSAYANTVPAYLVAAFIFIVMNYLLTKAASYVEARIKRSGHTSAAAADETEAEIDDVDVPGGPAAHGKERAGRLTHDAAGRAREFAEGRRRHGRDDDAERPSGGPTPPDDQSVR